MMGEKFINKSSFVSFALFALVAGFIGGYFGTKYRIDYNKGDRGLKETAYERVMRTQTLRCGYVNEPPHIIKDPNTGNINGLIADIMEEAGRLLGIKIEWTEEVGWGNTVEAIKSGRVDAICVNFWMNPAEGKYLGYSMPLYYGILAGFVRKDDHRFDNNLAAVNDESVTISSTDGELSGIIAQQKFPKAKVLSMPNMTQSIDNLLNVVTGKADITFVDALTGILYERKNPVSIRNPSPNQIWQAFPSTIALPQSDIALKTMLDSAFVQLLYGGFVDKILNKYGIPPEGILRVRKPYEMPFETKSALSAMDESDKYPVNQ